VPKLSYDMTIT